MDANKNEAYRPQSITDLCARTGDDMICMAAAFVNTAATEEAAAGAIRAEQTITPSSPRPTRNH